MIRLLIDYVAYPSIFFNREQVLRIFLKNQTKFYYSDRVFDIILFENYTDEMGLGALQISGYKSGKISLFFPKEAYYNTPRKLDQKIVVNKIE